MAKKKYRDIVVDDVKYAWAVRVVCSWYQIPYLKVWKDKKVILDLQLPKDGSEITPKYVADKIKLYETKH